MNKKYKKIYERRYNICLKLSKNVFTISNFVQTCSM